MSFPTSHAIESSSSSSPQPCRQFTFLEIERATRNFDESLVIGRGGFGKVYRGTITCGEVFLDAAIKRLESTSNQGAVEFWAEVEMLSKLRHCHLVSLIGYCNDGQEMILVYEYIPKGTLADQLHKHRAPPTWVRRLKICIGAARSLDYLHTGTGIKHGVIHRDVKSTNILLDNNWAAKVSDFGLSKIGPTNQPSTYVNTLVRGTFGYMDPDYFQTGRLTRKSDVYAFGLVLFEVLCRKQAVDRSIDEEQWSLATWAQDSIKEGRLKQIVDSNLRERISPKCLKEFALLADRCLHSRPKLRPTMAEVVVSLESILALQEKTESTWLPTFLFPSTWEKSAVRTSLKSLDRYLYTVGGEDRIVHRFDFNTIIYATDNFSEANKILPRYEYTMYKGRLQNGQDITITQFSEAFTYKECMNEASILVKVEHENLMQLLGYCIHGTKVYLIYDFPLNATLAGLIYDPMRNLLDWDKRYKILLGIARALVYLHRHAPIRIIHRHVKPANILIDECYNPRLSGFGVALTNNETDCVYVENLPGTLGYIAPECHSSFCFSTKADVYSFGILIFETITGKSIWNLSPPDIDNVLCPAEYVQKNWLEGTLSDIIDPRIDVNLVLMPKFLEIGLCCVQYSARDRPTMEEVIGMLLDTSSLTFHVSEMRERIKSLGRYPYTVGGEDRIVHRFDFNTIIYATDNFSEANKISSSTYKFTMYKGRLQNGQDITITQYSKAFTYKMSMNEASILVKVEHENLIQLIGYCVEGTSVYLIFDYAFNATLHNLIFDPMCNLLDWNKRYKIILGVAKVLVYLHNHAPIRIIHRDVTPSNILLDESFDPKLSDFGAAIAIYETDHIFVDRVFESYEYMAPEYAMEGDVSAKTDVFSFGVLVLETVTGKRKEDFRFGRLLNSVVDNWLEGKLSNIIDPRIDVDLILMTKFIEIGLLCVQMDAANRPTMKEVVDMLLGTSSLTLPVSEMRARINKEESLDFDSMRARIDEEESLDFDSNEPCAPSLQVKYPCTPSSRVKYSWVQLWTQKNYLGES